LSELTRSDLTGSDVIEQVPKRRSALRLVTLPLSLLLIVLAVAAGGLLVRNLPGSVEMTRPFIQSGRIGDTVDGITFTVVVLGVRGAQRVLDSSDNQVDTDGVYLLVEVKVLAKTEGVNLGHVTVVDRAGRIFGLPDRIEQRFDIGYRFEPGIPIEGDIAFEVPQDALAGLVLHLSAQSFVEADYEAVAEVDLGIDDATATKWADEPRRLEMKLPLVSR
jgi:hypothetical protein